MGDNIPKRMKAAIIKNWRRGNRGSKSRDQPINHEPADSGPLYGCQSENFF